MINMDTIEFLTQEEKENMSINDLEAYIELLTLIKNELSSKAE